MVWRLIPFEYRAAAMNMALDETVSNGIAAATSPPTIRFYGWRPSAVSIGRFQNLRDEVDLDRCRELGIEFVRRRTGGGAVFHDSDGEITYSLIAPEDLMPEDINAAYKEICGYIVSALAGLGVEAKFAPINDISVARQEDIRKRAIAAEFGIPAARDPSFEDRPRQDVQRPEGQRCQERWNGTSPLPRNG